MAERASALRLRRSLRLPASTVRFWSLALSLLVRACSACYCQELRESLTPGQRAASSAPSLWSPTPTAPRCGTAGTWHAATCTARRVLRHLHAPTMRTHAHTLTRARGFTQEVRWDTVLRQRVNTVSNLPFAVTGAHVSALGWQDWQQRRRPPGLSRLELHPGFSLLFGASQLWIAAGSALFHASWTRAGQRADMGAVYCSLLLPSAYLALRLGLLGPGRTGRAGFMALSLCASAYMTVNKWHLKSSVVVPAQIAALCLLLLLWLALGSPTPHAQRWWTGPVARERPQGLALRLLLASALCTGAAFAATAADMTRVAACRPRALFQWHSVWHVCAAAGLWLLYAFLRSEAHGNFHPSGAANQPAELNCDVTRA